MFLFGVLFLFLHPKVTITQCIVPPMKCPNENITFWLYTRENSEEPHQLFFNKPSSIINAPWVKNAPIKILIHGYTGHKDYSPNTEIRPAYLENFNYNIISIDYEPIALEHCYIEAAYNTRLVGKCTAQLIDSLVLAYGFKLKAFHVIGFSLGAQVAGYVGNNLKSGRLKRITALDPALPLFITRDASKKIDKDDAKFVDVLHTNALQRGKWEQCGHLDFFANGGVTQPGCIATDNQSRSSCNHARAPAYFAESIKSSIGFYGTKCSSWFNYMTGWCKLFNFSPKVLFGEHCPKHATGLYFFSTNSESPFAMGPSGS